MLSFQFHTSAKVGRGVVSWAMPYPLSNDRLGPPRPSKCRILVSCCKSLSQPRLSAGVRSRYVLIKAASGFWPMMLTETDADCPPADALITSCPPRLAMSFRASHSLELVLAVPDALYVFQVMVQ